MAVISLVVPGVVLGAYATGSLWCTPFPLPGVLPQLSRVFLLSLDMDVEIGSEWLHLVLLE